MLLDRKFNENFKNVLKTVIFSPQVDFTGDFVRFLKSTLSRTQTSALYRTRGGKLNYVSLCFIF